TVVNLQPVSREQHLAEQKSIQRLRAVSNERTRTETQIVARGTAPTKPSDPPHVVAVELPKPAAAAKTTEKQQPPPPPVVHGRPQIRTDTASPLTPARPEPNPRPTPPLNAA